MTWAQVIDRLVPMNNNDWIFKDGVAKFPCDSFPYAYRLMYETIKAGVETKRKYNDMMNQMSIISPNKTPHGDIRQYSYTESTAMAKDQGLLTSSGHLNKREFQEKYQN